MRAISGSDRGLTLRLTVSMVRPLCLFAYTVFGMAAPSNALSAEDLRQILIANSSQIESFRGNYTLNHRVENGYSFEAHVHYRFSGADRYYSSVAEAHDPNFTEGSIERTTKQAFAQRDGWISTLTIRDDGAQDVVLGAKGEWPIPAGSEMTPQTLTGAIVEGRPAHQRLLTGTVEMKDQEGLRVVSHVMGQVNRADYYLDSEDRLIKVVQGFIPYAEIRERWAHEHPDSRPNDLFMVLRSVEYSDYEIIDGVEVPTVCRQTVYMHPEKSIKLLEAQSIRELDIEELGRAFTAEGRAYASQTMVLDRESTEINPILSHEDFEIPIEKGAAVFDVVLNRGYIEGEDEKAMLDGIAKELAEVEIPSLSRNGAPIESAPTASSPSTNDVPRGSILRTWLFPISVAVLVFGVSAVGMFRWLRR